jgi:hypothetical protein
MRSAQTMKIPIYLTVLLVAGCFAQTRVQLSQIRNLAQISPAPVAPRSGGTQLNLNQAKWPGPSFQVPPSATPLLSFFTVAQIVDMIAQANTGRVFSYVFQGAKVYEYRPVAFNDIKLPNYVVQPFQSAWEDTFTGDSLAWYRLVSPISSDLLTVEGQRGNP